MHLKHTLAALAASPGAVFASPAARPQATTSPAPTVGTAVTSPVPTATTVTGPPQLNFSELPEACSTTETQAQSTGGTTVTAVTTNAAPTDTPVTTGTGSGPQTTTANTPQTWPVPDSVIPSDDDAKTLVGHLQAWIKSGYAKGDNADYAAAIDAARLYTRLGTAPDGDGVFYAGADGGDAANSAFQIQQGKITVGTAYYGYGRFPFDYCIQPGAAIAEADREANNHDVLNAWFRITSIAFAQICSGTVWLVSNDANWRDSKGSGGDSSIFVMDEAAALAANSEVTKIYQVSTGAAYLWSQDTEPALQVVANDALPGDTDWANGKLLAYLIYDRDNGGFQDGQGGA